MRKGEFTALLGANGAGKITLLKAASNLLPAERGQITGGRIRYKACDVTTDTPHAYFRNGLVPAPEGERCFKPLSIEENLTTAAGRGIDRAQIAQALEQVYDLSPS